MPALDLQALDALIDRALAEDLGPGDATTAALVEPAAQAEGRLVALQDGVLAGVPVAQRLLQRFDPELRIAAELEDGAALNPGALIGVVAGPAAPMLSVERTLLNFLQRLSGIATLTGRYVDAVAGTGVKILDTRKTLPGWRALAKYAVAVGGGTNHRAGLYDQVLIKDNHLAVTGLAPADAVARARSRAPADLRIEVEVATVADAQAAAEAGADIVMLDNMSPDRLKEAVDAVRRVRPQTTIEASGGVTLDNVGAVAAGGVDWISVGALTHSAPGLDISLAVEAT
jgi:nicotinate-nucleotide pyrophosphorylase (carboxylating)